jgi:hypothetical protein
VTAGRRCLRRSTYAVHRVAWAGSARLRGKSFTELVRAARVAGVRHVLDDPLSALASCFFVS